MKVKVYFKAPVSDMGKSSKEFRATSYGMSEDGDLDIYIGNTVVATVREGEWIYAEKVYEEGEELPSEEVSPVHPQDAEDFADSVAESPGQIRVDNFPLEHN